MPKPTPTGPTLAQLTQPRLEALLLELTCRTCAFHDWHRLSDLRERYGGAALLAEVVPHLTLRCLRRRDPGAYGVWRAVLIEVASG